jgi:hypothetical protein
LNKELKIGVLIDKDDPLKAIPIAKELNAYSINPEYILLTKLNVKKIKRIVLK